MKMRIKVLKSKSKFLTFFITLLLGCSGGEEEMKTFYAVPNLENGKDALIAKAYPNSNYGRHEILHLTSRIKSDSIEDDNRFVLSFNLKRIDKSAKIDSAFIYLYNNGKRNYGEHSFLIQRITYPWKENRVTWLNQPAVDTTNQIKINNSQNDNEDYKIGVTPFVKNFVGEKHRNLGFMFRLANEDLADKRVNFFASNCSNQSKRPKLEVYYRVRE